MVPDGQRRKAGLEVGGHAKGPGWHSGSAEGFEVDTGVVWSVAVLGSPCSGPVQEVVGQARGWEEQLAALRWSR